MWPNNVILPDAERSVQSFQDGRMGWNRYTNFAVAAVGWRSSCVAPAIATIVTVRMSAVMRLDKSQLEQLANVTAEPRRGKKTIAMR